MKRFCNAGIDAHRLSWVSRYARTAYTQVSVISSYDKDTLREVDCQPLNAAHAPYLFINSTFSTSARSRMFSMVSSTTRRFASSAESRGRPAVTITSMRVWGPISPTMGQGIGQNSLWMCVFTASSPDKRPRSRC